MKNKEFYDKQNKILGKMVDILVENKYFITNYNGYKRWAGTHPLSYKEWLMCWENKTIQDAALRYGYKGELLDKSLIRE